MIDNCGDCKTKCCSVGPGPYKTVDPEIFLLNFGEHDIYNKKCKGFVDGKCSYWNTDKIPLECKIYVCTTRKFSESELDHIRELTGRDL